MSSDSPVRYVLDAVRVTGNSKTRTRVILRFIPFKAGDVLDVDDKRITLTRYRLLGTGFFRDVSFSLSKGHKRGHVILNIRVKERNTIVVSDLWMGLSASAESDGRQPAQFLSPYAGLDAAETNLLGTGMSLGAAVAFSDQQRALALRFLNPAPTDGDWMLSGRALVNDGLGFFGNSTVFWDDPRQTTAVPRQAVVEYLRTGGEVGLGRDLGVATQVWFAYRLESVRAQPPLAAAHEYGGVLEPLDFHVHRGRSILTTLRGAIQYDTRDTPILTRQGVKLSAAAEVSLPPTGSDYAYQRLDIEAAQWWPLPLGHTVKLRAFAGAIAGYAPFFERFHISDLSDFRPGRVLGLAFDDRPSPNFLGTSISEIRYGDFAARLEAEYRLPLYRGHRSIYGVDLFISGGVIGLAGQRDLTSPPRNLEGARLIPADLTGNLGVQLDTSLGGMTFSFANLVGFLPLGGEHP